MNRYCTGCSAIRNGFRFLFAHRRLGIYAAIPLCIQATLFVGLLLYAWHHVDPVTHWLTSLLVIVIVFFAASFAAYLIGMLIAAPFNDLLSEQTEVYATGHAPPPFSWRLFCRGVLRSIQVELQKTLLFVAVPTGLLILHLLPVLGSLLFFLGTTWFACWATGMTFLDYPMARRGLPFRQRLAFGWRHRREAVGFGLGFLIPGFVLFCSAPLIIGGTLLYVEINPKPAIRNPKV